MSLLAQPLTVQVFSTYVKHFIVEVMVMFKLFLMILFAPPFSSRVVALYTWKCRIHVSLLICHNIFVGVL